mgnify:CR=1 FL=1
MAWYFIPLAIVYGISVWWHVALKEEWPNIKRSASNIQTHYENRSTLYYLFSETMRWIYALGYIFVTGALIYFFYRFLFVTFVRPIIWDIMRAFG